MRKFIKNYSWHALSWVIFIAYEVTSVKVVTGIFGSSKNYLMHYPINIALVYLLSGYILPRTIGGKRKSYPLLLALLALSMLIFLMASNIADRILGRISEEVFFGNAGITKIFIGGTIYRGIYFMGFGITLFLYQNRISILERTGELERETAEKDLHQSQLALELAAAKNAYLRAQINPHFMFSTLSYIHDSTRLSEPETAEAVLYLSKLLRYALSSERGPEKIPLCNEIEQVENLLNITRIRKAQTYIRFIYDPKNGETEVIPFVLLSLAENMLKHGNLSEEAKPGLISVTVHEDKLLIETNNLISSGINDTGFHTGLSSIEQRLVQIYGNRASISYGIDESKRFVATVNLPLMVKPEPALR
jgi:two-component system LytT family sensor kinase